jgi:hypothetical protein
MVISGSNVTKGQRCRGKIVERKLPIRTWKLDCGLAIRWVQSAIEIAEVDRTEARRNLSENYSQVSNLEGDDLVYEVGERLIDS